LKHHHRNECDNLGTRLLNSLNSVWQMTTTTSKHIIWYSDGSI